MTTLPGIASPAAISAPKINKPRRHIFRMMVFLAIVTGIAFFLYQPARNAFVANPYLNGLILATLLFGIIFIFRQVLILNTEVDWTENLKKTSSGISLQSGPNLLSPLATIIRDNNGPLQMSAITMNTVLDSISARLDEGRDISRYLINVLVFLGLLGTFWGLLETVDSVGDAITTLNVGSSNDFSKVFDELKAGLEKPLSGMAVAFSSSLFGLSGSLILGFLDMQAGQAQSRFYTDLEEWLTSITKFTSSGPVGLGDGDHSVPAYVNALLEQTAESLDSLQRTLARNEDRRHTGESAMLNVSERLAALTDQMRAEQDLMVKLVEGQMELKPVLQRMAQIQEQGALDQASKNHLRNLDVYMARLLEDISDGRNQITQEIRSDIKLLTRTIAAIAEEDRRK
ncbi:flagellar motor protein MotA [Alphaproteobacteria bacterium 46_93_T64]|nr:flagellar motor protein MotA [Alphaproteobacteria bacterium 46_93_T64]